MNKQQVIKRVLTVSFCASIGLTSLLAGTSTTEAATSKYHTTSKSTSTTSKSTNTTTASKLIAYGKTFTGVPYKFGASTSTTSVFDCSSFTKRVFSKYGVTLPRTAAAQSKEGVAVSKANLQPGDLVFFSSGSRATGSNVTHVAIYAGNGKILHTYGKPGVTISDLNSGTWKRTYLKARRVL